MLNWRIGKNRILVKILALLVVQAFLCANIAYPEHGTGTLRPIVGTTIERVEEALDASKDDVEEVEIKQDPDWGDDEDYLLQQERYYRSTGDADDILSLVIRVLDYVMDIDLRAEVGDGGVVSIGFGNDASEILVLAETFNESTIHAVDWIGDNVRYAQEDISKEQQDVRSRIRLYHEDASDLRAVLPDNSVKMAFIRNVLTPENFDYDPSRIDLIIDELSRIMADGGYILILPRVNADDPMVQGFRDRGFEIISDAIYQRKPGITYASPGLIVRKRARGDIDSSSKFPDIESSDELRLSGKGGILHASWAHVGKAHREEHYRDDIELTEGNEIRQEIVVEGQSFSVSTDIIDTLSDGEVRALLAAALAETHFEVRDEHIALSSISRSPRLFENCKQDGFIGINEAFLELYQDSKNNPTIKEYLEILLQVGLEHELLHEIGGIPEENLLDRDIKRIIALCREQDVKINKLLRFLRNRGIIHADFVSIFDSILVEYAWEMLERRGKLVVRDFVREYPMDSQKGSVLLKWMAKSYETGVKIELFSRTEREIPSLCYIRTFEPKDPIVGKYDPVEFVLTSDRIARELVPLRDECFSGVKDLESLAMRLGLLAVGSQQYKYFQNVAAILSAIVPEEERDFYTTLALFHDIGKTGSLNTYLMTRIQITALYDMSETDVIRTIMKIFSADSSVTREFGVYVPGLTIAEYISLLNKLSEDSIYHISEAQGQSIIEILKKVDNPKTKELFDPFTDTMLQFIDAHTYWSVEVLDSKDIPEEIVNAIKFHHIYKGVFTEEADILLGMTYSAKLAAARLFLVDVYDALRARSVRTHEEAIDILETKIEEALNVISEADLDEARLSQLDELESAYRQALDEIRALTVTYEDGAVAEIWKGSSLEYVIPEKGIRQQL